MLIDKTRVHDCLIIYMNRSKLKGSAKMGLSAPTPFIAQSWEVDGLRVAVRELDTFELLEWALCGMGISDPVSPWSLLAVVDWCEL